jgi:hypothetical protein
MAAAARRYRGASTASVIHWRAASPRCIEDSWRYGGRPSRLSARVEQGAGRDKDAWAPVRRITCRYGNYTCQLLENLITRRDNRSTFVANLIE